MRAGGIALIASLCALALACPAAAGAAKRLDGATQLPIAGLGGSLQNPCWSPLGDELALTNFTGGYNRGNSVVQVVPATGGAPLRSLSFGHVQSVNLPGSCWNGPTGLLTFTADPVTRDQVFVVPGAGGTPTALTQPPIVAFEPSFSPDGTQIVFERFRKGRSEIWKVGPGGALTRLTSGFNDRQPNWSPKGDLIVFQRTRKGKGEFPADLYLVPAAGGRAFAVTRTKKLEETDVSWSPSGQFLLFSSDGGKIDIASLFTIGVNGAGKQQLTRTRKIYDGAPSWSPDGSRIAFESRPGDPDGSPGTTLWVIPAPAGRS